MILTNLLGTQGMSKGNLATFSLFFWFNRAYRAHFSAHSLEGFKAAQIYRIHARSMFFAIALALVVGTLSAFWGILHNFHVYGYSGRPAGDAFSAESWNRMAAWISLPQLPKVAASVACGIGLVFALVLGALRMKFTWWLWHPVGYATCSTWSMEKLWMCLFIGWLVKLLITRYGGAQTYRKLLPFLSAWCWVNLSSAACGASLAESPESRCIISGEGNPPHSFCHPWILEKHNPPASQNPRFRSVSPRVLWRLPAP
ncbi:MAG: hypothetical protein UZ16_OP3001002022 [Candidatus Hinthialibacteria bacterium OLB16]|nr:MAG: hypothetical protein UZ16_OP3001002022 [Candidatus Hinthialibacteria bacterium OLB16]